jgi:predicted Zn-ribbon and HTH transcriptional regulator
MTDFRLRTEITKDEEIIKQLNYQRYKMRLKHTVTLKNKEAIKHGYEPIKHCQKKKRSQ